MDILVKDLVKLWGEPINQEKIGLDLPIGLISTDTGQLRRATSLSL